MDMICNCYGVLACINDFLLLKFYVKNTDESIKSYKINSLKIILARLS